MPPCDHLALAEKTVVIQDGSHRCELHHTLAKASTHRIKDVQIKKLIVLWYRVADDFNRNDGLVFIRVKFKCTGHAQIVIATESCPIPGGIVHAINLIWVASHPRELQQEIGVTGTTVALRNFPFNIVWLGWCIRVVGAQALVDPLLVSAHSLPSGNFTKTAVEAGVNVGRNTASAQACGVRGYTGNITIQKRRPTTVARCNQPFVKALP